MLRNFDEQGFDEDGFNADGINAEGHYSVSHDEAFNKPIPGQLSMFPGEDIPMK